MPLMALLAVLTERLLQAAAIAALAPAQEVWGEETVPAVIPESPLLCHVQGLRALPGRPVARELERNPVLVGLAAPAPLLVSMPGLDSREATPDLGWVPEGAWAPAAAWPLA
jgi:hypothetical protein